MAINTIQDILPFVEKPSHYLGSETNAVRKDPENVDLTVALAFPDLYEIGTSHFGLQILYNILNSKDHIAAERVFTPAEDMEKQLKANALPLSSLESRKPLNEFDIIGFSLLYELNNTNILTMLELSQIPFMASERDNSHPFIIAGGPCTCNPEPVADFFDAFIVGDGERAIVDVCDALIKWKKAGNTNREELLKSWSNIEGVYIPSFFDASYSNSVSEYSSDGGFQVLTPRFPDYTKTTRTIVEDLESEDFPLSPVVPNGKPVHDRLRLEIARGCSRGCRFCQAGMIYRPVRERSVDNLIDITERSLSSTGYDDISFLSLSTGDYGCLIPLMEKFMKKYEKQHTAVSLPSIRAGRLTPELMELIQRVRKTGFTIAPEAGTQRLRDVINKNITEREITSTVKNAFSLGWQVIKLYFMIGLPTETDEDLQGIVDLTDKLRKLEGPNGRKGKINVSVTTFIPKPHAPFQWAPQIPLEESKRKIFRLKKALKMPGVHFKWQDPRVSLLEGLFARGDRRLSKLLVNAYNKGCKFDGWSDKFKFHLWEEAFDETAVNVDSFTTRIRDLAEPLPWDHIDIRVSKSFLAGEWKKAVACDLTPDCRTGICSGCGVCDFKDIKPQLYRQFTKPEASDEDNGRSDNNYKTLKVTYSKQGNARFYGHLELVNIFLRALKRAGVTLKFTEGFHPKPKITFDDPLPIGIESLEENFYVAVPVTVRPEDIVTSLEGQLPEGLKAYACNHFEKPGSTDTRKKTKYSVSLKDININKDLYSDFLNSESVTVTRTNKKGKVREINLREVVSELELIGDREIKMTLGSETGKTVRPAEVLMTVFKLSKEDILQSTIVKIPS